MGLHQAVALCMYHCHASELTRDDAWFKIVVLSGGTACLPGLAERLEKELNELFFPFPREWNKSHSSYSWCKYCMV
ncbi:hypothetical protein CRYUN_Cryun39dG0001300 [Craigia yunnanensis]